MERQELLNYVKDVYELESQLYSLQRVEEYYLDLYNEMEKDKERICFAEDFTSDTREKYNSQIEWNNKQQYPERMNDAHTYMFTPREFANASFNFLDRGLYLPPRYIKDLRTIVDKLKKNIFTKGNCFDCNSNSKLRKEYQALYEDRYYEELKQKKEWYEPRLANLKIEHNDNIVPSCIQTEELIDKIYSLDIIHPKYRNFFAIAQIYEYLDTGRCDTLEGPNGAYNLYEQELRQNTIINRLDQVIDQLKELNETMHYICSSIQTTNNLLSQISSQIAQVEANTACIAYNSQCIAYNTNIANKYNF